LKITNDRRPLRAGFAAAISLAVLLSLVLLAGAGFAKSSITAAQYQYGPKGKTTICHKGKTITVANRALRGHRKHGDAAGACPDRRKGKRHDKGHKPHDEARPDDPKKAEHADDAKKADDDKKVDDRKKGDDERKADDGKKADEKPVAKPEAPAPPQRPAARSDDHGKAGDDHGKAGEDHGKPADAPGKPEDKGGRGKGK
jgi:hypothetical protein